MRVDVEDVFENANESHQWNSQNFDDLEFYRDGKKVDLSEDEIRDFKLVGLCNADFVLMRDWDDEETDNEEDKLWVKK